MAVQVGRVRSRNLNMNILKLKDLQLGSLDAKNELIEDTDEVKELFTNSYVLPPNFDLDKFYQKKNYFITGLKGTGKTALLRYISIKLEEDSNTYSKFILFKSDLRSRDISAGLEKIVDTTTIYETKNISDEKDYQTLWRWFIYSEIVSYQKKKDIDLFVNNQDWKDFSEKASIVKKTSSLFPKLKNGRLSLSAEALNTKVSGEIGIESDKVNNISFNDYIIELDDLFESLIPSSDKLNLFFDELELNYLQNKQYKKEANLIKDLILSIEKFNAICRKNKFPIFIYAAIRSEVLSIISGNELNKSLSDFGNNLSWHGAGNDEKQPLLNVITKRLAYQLNCSLEEVWEELFPPKIQKKDTRKYILHHSWYRPRDVIRFLTLAQKQDGEKKKFEHKMFDAIQYKYSESSWHELVEELRAKYTEEEVKGIERVFYGFKSSFSYEEFKSRLEYIAREFKDTEEKIPIASDIKKLLEILYRIGLIGNQFYRNKGNRDSYMVQFSFRGNPNVDYDKDFLVHYAVRRYLNLDKSK